MSKSYRDNERRAYKANYEDMHNALTAGSPDTAQKVKNCKEAKKIVRQGNQRKTNAAEKLKYRRIKRKKLNVFSSEE